MLSQLELSDDESLAEVGKTEDDETRRLRIAILDAEREEDKMAAAGELIAQRDAIIAQLDAEKEVALAEATAKDAEVTAKDAEIAQLRAQLSR